MNKLERTTLILEMTAEQCNSVLDQYGRQACVYNEFWARGQSTNIYNAGETIDDDYSDTYHNNVWSSDDFGDDLRRFNDVCYGGFYDVSEVYPYSTSYVHVAHSLTLSHPCTLTLPSFPTEPGQTMPA